MTSCAAWLPTVMTLPVATPDDAVSAARQAAWALAASGFDAIATGPVEKALLKEFDAYRSFTGRKIKESRLEVLRAGFRAAWAAKDYQTIIGIANKLPEETLQEDEKLLTLYDLALTRTEDGI